MKRLVFVFALLLTLASLSYATVTATTLGAAVSTTSERTITVASSTGAAAGYTAIVDNEALTITSVPDSTTIRVVRGASGTRTATHSSGVAIYFGPSNEISTRLKIQFGKATLASGSPSTVTVTLSEAYNSSASYKCVVSIESASAVTTEVNASYSSGTAFVITGTNSATDVVDYICAGY